MISITAVYFDLDGELLFEARRYFTDSDQGLFQRRISKTATFGGDDGYNVEVEDAGFSDGDREHQVVVPYPTEAEVSIARGLARNHARVRVSDESGCFEAGIESVIYGPPGLSIVLSIYRRLSA